MSNEETLRKLALQVRNWGKWGPEDEIGTLNYITPEKIAQASRLVTAGKVFALGLPLQRNGPPGVSVYTAPWLHAREIAAIGSDNYAVEIRPSELPPFRSPFHICAIPNMGLTLGEIFYLEELAADCAADGRYEFLLVAPPLPVTNAVGTPINPYALK